MRAATWNELGAQPALRDDLPAPTPGASEVLVRAHASSVNPVDDGIAAGMVKDMVPHDFPVTLGRDFGRVVEPVGDGVTGVSAGDEVFGFVPAIAPTVHAGAWAELIAVPEAGIRRKPDGVDTAAALAAVTAVLCVDALDLSQGDTMPIAGAAGEGPGRTNVIAAPSSEIPGADRAAPRGRHARGAICRTVLPTRAVRASVGSGGAVGGDSDCTDSLTSRGRVRPLLGVTFKFAHSER
jgi:D-arabinose 1-dehydrogenase-like Zn-dependent alcohol dehydrogenase